MSHADCGDKIQQDPLFLPSSLSQSLLQSPYRQLLSPMAVDVDQTPFSGPEPPVLPEPTTLEDRPATGQKRLMEEVKNSSEDEDGYEVEAVLARRFNRNVCDPCVEILACKLMFIWRHNL